MTENSEFILMGVTMRRLVAADETKGAFSLFENRSDGPTRTPVHVHRDDDETLYVLDGQMQAVIDGHPRTVHAGEAVFLPRGIPHQLSNEAGVPTRYLLLCTPSVFEGFLMEAGRPRRPGETPLMPSSEDVRRLKEAAPRHGITILPGW